VTKRILIIEDQEDNRTILRDLLSTVGYALIEAVDGHEGVKLARSERPDLILMDIQLPGLDGYEATRQIRATEELKSVPIIAVTSYALSGDEVKARAAGCDGYVTKPFSPRELLAKVREYLHAGD
jgi:two-component system cell cycle response regulator DivK